MGIFTSTRQNDKLGSPFKQTKGRPETVEVNQKEKCSELLLVPGSLFNLASRISVAQLSDIGFWARAGHDAGWFWHWGSQVLIWWSRGKTGHGQYRQLRSPLFISAALRWNRFNYTLWLLDGYLFLTTNNGWSCWSFRECQNQPEHLCVWWYCSGL